MWICSCTRTAIPAPWRESAGGYPRSGSWICLGGWIGRTWIYGFSMEIRVILPSEERLRAFGDALGLAAILVTYVQPGSYAVTNQGPLYSWELGFEALG